MFILSGVSGQAAYENVVMDFLFYSLFTPVCATMMNRIMFASEQLMAAKSAVNRVDEILQEQPLKEPEQPLILADASIVFSDVSFAYPGAKEKALDHISFEVPTGKQWRSLVPLAVVKVQRQASFPDFMMFNQVLLRLAAWMYAISRSRN